MVEPTKKVWLNGELVGWNDANVPIMTHGLHYGIGAFEGIRCYKLTSGKSGIFRLKCHLRRLFNGLKILDMDIPYTQEQLLKACIDTVHANDLDECYLRPIMYSGEGAMGLSAKNPTRCAIPVWKWGTYLGDGALERGIRAKVSSFNRHHVNVSMVQGKITGQYVPSILAKREAMASGYDEGIMLDTHGYVAEGTGENLFIVRDGVIFTPPLSSPILPGITRDTVITIARELDLTVREELFTRDVLYLCDEVFMTGTAAEITPVCEVDNRAVGAGRPGPVTQKLQKAYFKVVHGEDERHLPWLTMI